jgi:outer membrane lipopolysaccharide assembly protein LptE/RlpB
MKRLLILATIAVTLLLLTGCGYQNTQLAARQQAAEVETVNGAPVMLHARMWRNRTNELGLQLAFYNQIHNWFQRSKLIRLARTMEEAEYTLDGEIIAIDEGLTRGTVRLTVGFTLQDLQRNEPLWQVQAQTFSETFFIADNAARTQDNKREALEKIADDLAESIYMRAHYLIYQHRQPAGE